MAGATEVPAPAPATDPTLLSRLDRLDVMMGYLEEIWGSRTGRGSSGEASCPGSDAGSGGETSPRSAEKPGCRPLREAVVETKAKGSLVDRVQHLEEHILQLSMQLEKEIEHERKKAEEGGDLVSPKGEKKPHGKKGLKSLVKSCIKGKQGSNN